METGEIKTSILDFGFWILDSGATEDFETARESIRARGREPTSRAIIGRGSYLGIYYYFYYSDGLSIVLYSMVPVTPMYTRWTWTK